LKARPSRFPFKGNSICHVITGIAQGKTWRVSVETFKYLRYSK